MAQLEATLEKHAGTLAVLDARLREEGDAGGTGVDTGGLTPSQAKFALEQVFSVVRSAFVSSSSTALTRDDAFVIVRYVAAVGNCRRETVYQVLGVRLPRRKPRVAFTWLVAMACLVVSQPRAARQCHTSRRRWCSRHRGTS